MALDADAISDRKAIAAECRRVAELGGWSDPFSILERLPTLEERAAGFDAGVACILNLIPPERQRLAAKLHAGYGDEAIAQVRRESVQLDPDSESTWWLAATEVFSRTKKAQGRVDMNGFLQQVREFQALAGDAQLRLETANACLTRMRRSFGEKTLGEHDRVPTGNLQGIYFAGYDFGVQPAGGLYFVGTWRSEGLGLEKFPWNHENGLSGPVHGSNQFVKCASLDELNVVLRWVKRHFEVARGEGDTFQASSRVPAARG